MKYLILYFFTLISITHATLGQPTETPQLRAMTFNIRYDNPNDLENWWELRKQDVTTLIKRYHPHFLGIQEGLDHQVSYLSKVLEDYQYVGVGRDGIGVTSEYTAIFYDTIQFKVIKTETFWLSPTPKVVSSGWDAALNRIATYGAFESKSSGKVVHVLNTHFDHMGDTARVESAKLIINQIKTLELERKHLILMGDFNSTPESEPIQTLNGLLTDTRNELEKRKFGPEGTFSGFDTAASLSSNRIDYVFFNNLKLIYQRHVDDLRPNLLWPSDHLPVLAAFEWPR